MSNSKKVKGVARLRYYAVRRTAIPGLIRIAKSTSPIVAALATFPASFPSCLFEYRDLGQRDPWLSWLSSGVLRADGLEQLTATAGDWKPALAEIETTLWNEAARAVDVYLGSRPVGEYYLYYRLPLADEIVGEVCFASGDHPAEWSLADPRAELGYTERRVLLARVHAVMRRLPMLSPPRPRAAQ